MAEHNFDAAGASGGPERSALLPASRPAIAPMVVRSGFGIPSRVGGFDPMLLLKSFRRRWTLATGLGVLAAVLVGGVAWLIIPPTQYSSWSMLRVSTHPPKIMFKSSELLADYRTFQRTQAELIKSRYVLGPALRDPKVAALPVVREQADPQEWLEKQIQVDFLNGSELLQISMSSKNPEELKPIVDAVVTSYMETVVADEHKGRVARLEKLQKLWNRYQEQLKEKRRILRSLSNVVGTEDRQTIALKQQFWQESLHNLERDLHSIQSDLRKFRVYDDVIRSKQEAAPPAAAGPGGGLAQAKTGEADQAGALAMEAQIDARIDADPSVHELRLIYEGARDKYDRLRKLSRKLDDPGLMAARNARQAAYDQLIDHRKRLRDHYINLIADSVAGNATGAPVGAEGQTYVARLRDQVEILRRQEAETLKEIEKFRQDLALLNGMTIDLQTEQDEIAVADSTAKEIAKEVEALDVELQAPNRITKLTPAEPPRKKDNTKQYLLCGGASFGGFALALLAVSFWEMRAMRIGSVDEVVNNLGLTLVGTLPALPGPGRKLAKGDDSRWQGLLVESIDATRTMLLHASRVSATRAVLITSAMKGEGKTSLAAHLATSLARAGRKTLLIDCDLRRPTLHQLFDVARVPGLCELLRGEAEINDVIRPTPADDLNLMAAGHCDGVALQAIAQEGFRDVLAILKKRYDFVIIDSAPVLPVVDTMLLAQQVDAVLFSIMRDVSRVPLVQASHDRLSSLGVRLLGAVVSAAGREDCMHNYDYEYQSTEIA